MCRPPSAPLSGSPPPHMLWVLPVGPVAGHPVRGRRSAAQACRPHRRVVGHNPPQAAPPPHARRGSLGPPNAARGRKKRVGGVNRRVGTPPLRGHGLVTSARGRGGRGGLGRRQPRPLPRPGGRRPAGRAGVAAGLAAWGEAARPPAVTRPLPEGARKWGGGAQAERRRPPSLVWSFRLHRRRCSRRAGCRVCASPRAGPARPRARVRPGHQRTWQPVEDGCAAGGPTRAGVAWQGLARASDGVVAGRARGGCWACVCARHRPRAAAGGSGPRPRGRAGWACRGCHPWSWRVQREMPRLQVGLGVWSGPPAGAVLGGGGTPPLKARGRVRGRGLRRRIRPPRREDRRNDQTLSSLLSDSERGATLARQTPILGLGRGGCARCGGTRQPGQRRFGWRFRGRHAQLIGTTDLLRMSDSGRLHLSNEGIRSCCHPYNYMVRSHARPIYLSEEKRSTSATHQTWPPA